MGDGGSLIRSALRRLIVPLVLLDLSVTLYQWVCFPLYRIPRVQRSRYFVFDRTHLAYLNLLEKINCAFCSYSNFTKEQKRFRPRFQKP